MEQERDITYQVETVTVANGTAASTFTKEVKLQQGYDKLEKVSISEITDGGDASAYEVGFNLDSENRIIPALPKEFYQFDASCPMEQRGRQLQGMAAGADVTIKTTTPDTTSTELKYKVVFQLSKPKNC